MLLFVNSVKLVAEIALLALLGQWVLGLLAGSRRQSNFFYQILEVVTKPFVKGTRMITPKIVLDRHVPLAAFVLLTMIWLVSTIARIGMCIEIGVQSCR